MTSGGAQLGGPYHIILLPRASADLAGIFSYIDQRSPKNAPRVAARLIASIDSLTDMPRRYEVHVSSRDPDRVVHSMPVPPYIVYYRVSSSRRAVQVLTIRHGARRQPLRFPK